MMLDIAEEYFEEINMEEIGVFSENSFGKIIVYYDNEQIELGAILNIVAKT